MVWNRELRSSSQVVYGKSVVFDKGTGTILRRKDSLSNK
jgi:hypothetical protein